MIFDSNDVYSLTNIGFALISITMLSCLGVVISTILSFKSNTLRGEYFADGFLRFFGILIIVSFVFLLVNKIGNFCEIEIFDYTEYSVSFYDDNFKNEMLNSSDIHVLKINDKDFNKYTLTGNVLAWSDKWEEYKSTAFKE